MLGFSLLKIPDFICAKGGRGIGCGACESCLVVHRLKAVQHWFPRAGDRTRKRFVLGLVRRLDCAELLHSVVRTLQPVTRKDFTYARSRPSPSLPTDVATFSCDRALGLDQVEPAALAAWEWFEKASFWTKTNFLLSLLPLCELHLLHAVLNHAHTVLGSGERTSRRTAHSDKIISGEMALSVAGSEHSYHSANRPGMELHRLANPNYGHLSIHPITGRKIKPRPVSTNIRDEDSGGESLTDSHESLADPNCFVDFESPEGYSGVSKYKDIIACLPVHLSKYTLGMLDEGSKNNALGVSVKWRQLLEEVLAEIDVSQRVREEVMVLQGAAAQGVNPRYAKDIDVLIPNVTANTWDVVCTDEAVVNTIFRSEASFEKAYSGISTRKVIMEERNIYCGAFNVMVLSNQEDCHRVVHTDGNRLIAVSLQDRKIRFINRETGKEQGPIIRGHAGSVRCVFLCEEKKILLSGSYDTSIRCWSIENGRCLRIFRGHRGTVVTLLVLDNIMASGAKDGSCKVWNLETGKCQRSFRHKRPVLAVALSTEMCITGCDDGKVKVWHLTTGEIIKKLSGHLSQVTCIKFDRWHIITGSKDGYALVWSSQGSHARCLTALRHPAAVHCLEFVYLRVITGSSDGRIRIWNMVTGQCCRIMRGNSRSDPILHLIAINNRITINTHANLLVLHFEEVEWDYDLENDKVPPLVQYGSYSDVPVCQHPYPYVRAKRMQRAGASNTKIMHHKNLVMSQSNKVQQQWSCRPFQISHSARSLSARSLRSARLIQSGKQLARSSINDRMPRSATAQDTVEMSSSFHSKPQISIRSCKPDIPENVEVTEVKHSSHGTSPCRLDRRISWAFENPMLPKSRDITLPETKALLRSQIRTKGKGLAPDFVYLTINAIQNAKKHRDAWESSKTVKGLELTSDMPQSRPSTSPSKIDPRMKISIKEFNISELKYKDGSDDNNNAVNVLRAKSAHSSIPEKETRTTKYESIPVRPKLCRRMMSQTVKSSIPQGRVIRPVTAAVTGRESNEVEDRNIRPHTAIGLKQPSTFGLDGTSNIPEQLPLSSSQGIGEIPMCIRPGDLSEKLKKLRRERQKRVNKLSRQANHVNDPVQSSMKFKLKTLGEEKEVRMRLAELHLRQKEEEAELEEKQRTLWLAAGQGQDSATP